MEFITIVYLAYSFVAFYFLFMFILLYVQNKKEIFTYPKITKAYSLSIVIPCYNEGSTIEETVKSVLNSGYENLKKVIVVDDCSKDGSFEIIKAIAKKYSKVMAVQTPKNTGKAAGSKNYGAKFVDTELIGFSDGDSFVEKGAIEKMIGFFDDKKVGSVTSSVLVQNRNKFIEKLQAIEYKVIKFSRKLLEFIDSIYVTPGPLGIFNKKIFDEIGGFDEENMTEDIEITWKIQANGYKVRMSVLSKAYTIAPSKIKDWVNQRNRWNIGGLQTIAKYKKTFFRKGMLGNFILPFFILSWALGLFGLGILIYRIIQMVVLRYLSTTYSVQAHTAIFRFGDINLVPNVLVFMGLTVFFLSLFFTIVALTNMREEGRRRENPLTIGFYMIFYLLAYPIILVISGYKYFRGYRKW